MIISVYGETDKRPVLYTLMDMMQILGDVWVVSPNRHLKRLLGDYDLMEGTYQNILVSIADTTEDEVYSELGHDPNDFDHILFDNLVPLNADLIIYVKGEGTSESEQFMLDQLDTYETITLGKSKDKGAIPYNVKMMSAMEHIEFARDFVEVDSKLTERLAKLIAGPTHTPEASLRKVVKR